MQEYKFSKSCKIRVRYGETDQMGYCYYGNYAQYFEVGRVEALRELGMSYKKMEDEGVMLPVSDFSVKYKRPAFYDDELTIETHVVKIEGARIFFEYVIYNDSKKEVSVAATTLVFVSKENMRPIAPPDNFLKAMSKYVK